MGIQFYILIITHKELYRSPYFLSRRFKIYKAAVRVGRGAFAPLGKVLPPSPVDFCKVNTSYKPSPPYILETLSFPSQPHFLYATLDTILGCVCTPFYDYL